MSSQLEANLNNILNEKTAKIIPENIKSGVEVFDVTGTYSGTADIVLISEADYEELAVKENKLYLIPEEEEEEQQQLNVQPLQSNLLNNNLVSPQIEEAEEEIEDIQEDGEVE